MGSSRSVEAARLKQSQEMELARSISEIDLVISARVHLALPDKEVFVRQQAEPTASVFLQLARGRSLGRSQSRGDFAFGVGFGSKPDQRKCLGC